MFCQYQYYRRDTKELQTAVAHSDGKYQCEEMSDCPYTGTTVINKISWGDWPGRGDDGEDDGETEESESDTDSEEDSEKEIFESTAATSTPAREQEELPTATGRKPGFMNKLKRLFRK